MISFGERCYSNQYEEISDDEFSDDEISGFANTTKFLATKFPPPPVYTAVNSSRTEKKLLSVYNVLHSYLNAGETLGERIINIPSLHLNESAGC